MEKNMTSKLYEGIMNGLNDSHEFVLHKNKLDLKTSAIEIEEPPMLKANKIHQIREKLNFSQAAFAKVIGVSKKTIEAWESGINKPNGPSRLILSLFDKDPKIINKYNLVHQI